MSLKIFEASRRLAAITAQFVTAGLDIEQFITSEDSTALQAHLASLREADPKAEQALNDALKTAAAYKTALAKFGATVAEPKAGETLDGNIEAALNARASIKAQEQLAKHGLAEPLVVSPSADATKTKTKATDPKLTGLSRTAAAWNTEFGERAARDA